MFLKIVSAWDFLSHAFSVSPNNFRIIYRGLGTENDNSVPTQFLASLDSSNIPATIMGGGGADVLLG
jgi:hypothetical protein